MDNKEENKVKAQGAEAKKEVQLKPTVWLKTLIETSNKLYTNGLIKEEEMKTIKEAHKKAVMRHMGVEV